MSETWRSIAGWEGTYEVSDLGNVRSLDRVVLGGIWGHQRWKGKQLAAPPGKNGYRTVCLSAPGRREYHNVHALVAQTFIGPCPPTLEVCHGNGVRSDCALTNLRYDTRRNNSLDRHAHGTMRTDGCPGEMNGLAKLTDDAVRDIRANPSTVLRVMAEKYGVSISAVSLAKNRTTWSHVS